MNNLIMIFNLREKCENSTKREYFYGRMQNSKIKDVYLGLCYLDPDESGRKAGAGKGHEEILYLPKGKILINEEDKEIVVNEGEAYFFPEGSHVLLKNLTKEKICLVVAGGHPKPHSQ
ncbi:MAG: cupin domain-containing protein [archaeon]|nr:cupin domain-containing protein [archaeon]